MPPNELDVHLKLPSQRRPDRLAVKAPNPLNSLISPSQLGRHQHPPVIRQTPGTGVQQLVQRRLDCQPIRHRIRPVVGVPLHVGSLAAQIEAPQSHPEPGDSAAMLVSPQNPLPEVRIARTRSRWYSSYRISPRCPEPLVAPRQPLRVRLPLRRTRQLDPLTVHALQSVQEHRSVGLLTDVLAHDHLVIGTNADEVPIEGRMVQLAQGQAVRHDRLAALIRVGDDVGGVQQLFVLQPAQGGGDQPGLGVRPSG